MLIDEFGKSLSWVGEKSKNVTNDNLVFWNIKVDGLEIIPS